MLMNSYNKFDSLIFVFFCVKLKIAIFADHVFSLNEMHNFLWWFFFLQMWYRFLYARTIWHVQLLNLEFIHKYFILLWSRVLSLSTICSVVLNYFSSPYSVYNSTHLPAFLLLIRMRLFFYNSSVSPSWERECVVYLIHEIIMIMLSVCIIETYVNKCVSKTGLLIKTTHLTFWTTQCVHLFSYEKKKSSSLDIRKDSRKSESEMRMRNNIFVDFLLLV